MSTAIEWTDETWNPSTGCDRVSPGCANCYIERTMPFRVEGRRFDEHGRMGVRLHPERLGKPLHWRTPRRVFVNSLSDLFHRDVPDDFLAEVFAVMALSRRHTFQVLTKRPKEMSARLVGAAFESAVARAATEVLASTGPTGRWALDTDGWLAVRTVGRGNQWHPRPWPLRNVWLGTSIESDRYTFRADWLRAAPAAVRFLSCEPLLGPLPSLDLTDIDWVIVGGESGPGYRPMDPEWALEVRDRCVSAGVPFFFKQWGGRWPKQLERELDGRTWDEMPAVVA